MNCSLCLRVNCGEKVNSQKTRCGTHILQQRLCTLVLWCDIALSYITAVVVFGVSKYTTAIQIMCIREVSCLHYLKSNLWWKAIHISIAQQPRVGQCLLIIEASWSHSRQTTLGRTLLDEWSARRRDFYVTALNTHKRQEVHAPCGIGTCDPSKRVVADLLHRLRGRWDRRNPHTVDRKCMFSNGCRSDKVLLF
jgi:hypothetical protein